MRKPALVLLLAVALPLLTAAPSFAWGHFHGGGRVFIGVGVGPWWGPWWWGPPPYYYAPPAVVVQDPPVYVQPQPAPAASPAPAGDWYYCGSAQAYYPNVPSCPEAWIKVPARP